MFHIIGHGEDMIYCEPDETWAPLEFPSCTKKTCTEGKYLAQDGTCVESECLKGKVLLMSRLRTLIYPPHFTIGIVQCKLNDPI